MTALMATMIRMFILTVCFRLFAPTIWLAMAGVTSFSHHEIVHEETAAEQEDYQYNVAHILFFDPQNIL